MLAPKWRQLGQRWLEAETGGKTETEAETETETETETDTETETRIAANAGR